MLEIKSISAGYGKRPVLREVSLTLHPGELLSVVGPNGCGKSTLLKAISGLLKITHGSLLCNGEDLRTLSSNARAARIAYLPQGQPVPNMTVEHLVLQGRYPHRYGLRGYTDEDLEAVHRALERVGLLSLSSTPVSALSGGQRQTAYVAMALAQETDYVLLDEPTTYLDVAHRLELVTLLRELAREGKGVLAVMHELPLTFSASHRIAVMENGALQAVGDPREICDSDIVGRVFGVPLLPPQGDADYRHSYPFQA